MKNLKTYSVYKFFFKILYVLIINTLGICVVNAQMDLRFEHFARTYPLAGYLRAEAGYSLPFWGSSKNNSPLYGMIRPHTQLQTSGVMNSGRAFLAVHPISFWSFYLGREYTHRTATNLPTYDCEAQTYCDTGLFKRNLWGTQLALKYKGLFYLTRIQWQTTILDENPFATFAEEQGTLLGRGTRDTLFYQTHILGWSLNEIQSIALLYKRNRIKSTHQNTTMAMMLYRHQFVDPFHPDKGRNFALSIGPGFYRTRQKTTHPSFMLQLLYNWERGLTLF